MKTDKKTRQRRASMYQETGKIRITLELSYDIEGESKAEVKKAAVEECREHGEVVMTEWEEDFC